ncbi:Ubiquitin- modifier 1 [Tieghemiomyces parasiticus]|uniref:Ubiquitin-related modifier 1 n=1 Tax=Tieghemiomyces parasiticus TaxID=78921 RepID=A0A9W8DVL1_9FUNG|nr:Ubiquitin- modifier 1 [Tieghemiomyces parasiticus]
MANLTVTVEFSGGLESLFPGVEQTVTLPTTNAAGAPSTVKDLIQWLRDNALKEKPELFVSGDTVRPGILVLINDVDWELEGELEYQLQAKDNVVYISTLHGG